MYSYSSYIELDNPSYGINIKLAIVFYIDDIYTYVAIYKAILGIHIVQNASRDCTCSRLCIMQKRSFPWFYGTWVKQTKHGA